MVFTTHWEPALKSEGPKEEFIQNETNIKVCHLRQIKKEILFHRQ